MIALNVRNNQVLVTILVEVTHGDIGRATAGSIDRRGREGACSRAQKDRDRLAPGIRHRQIHVAVRVEEGAPVLLVGAAGECQP